MESNKNTEYKVTYLSTSGVYKTPYTLIILVQLFIGGMVLVIVNLWFVNSLYYQLTGAEFYSSGISSEWWHWILLPLNIYGNIFLFAFSIIIFSAAVNKYFLQSPKEGVFTRGSKEWKNMHRRFWLAYFPIWLARALPLPWADIVVYRLFGTKMGKNVVAYEGYIDPQLVEIGDFTMTSLHICIFSHLIYHDKVVIKKVIVEKNCIVGPQTIISPGTIMEEGAILGANSYTWVGQTLDSYLIHVGTPVSMKLPIQTVEEAKQKIEKTQKAPELKENSNEKIELKGGDP
ncbi:MAG: acyltransferase [Promethearchaeota archaeon]